MALNQAARYNQYINKLFVLGESAFNMYIKYWYSNISEKNNLLPMTYGLLILFQ